MKKLFKCVLFVLLLLSFSESRAVDVFLYQGSEDSKPWIHCLNVRKIIVSSNDIILEGVNGYTNSVAFDDLSRFTFYSSVVAGVESRPATGTEVRFGGDVLTVNSPSPINSVSVYSIGGATCINDAPRTVTAQYSLAHLQKGVYLVKVVATDGIKVTKILKN